MRYINELADSPFGVSDIVEVLEEVSDLFYPPFKDRVLQKSKEVSLESYVLKVLENGHILILHNSSEIEGITMFYANDFKGGRSYIPLVAVREKFHNQGVAKMLVKEAIRLIKQYGMTTITIKTWKENVIASVLYQKLGFDIVEINESDIIMELYLRKNF